MQPQVALSFVGVLSRTSYKGYMIKEYLASCHLHMSDATFGMTDNSTIVHHRRAEHWKVTLVDAGDATMTGGRLLRPLAYW
jgi:glucose-1-phosphate cytidylyltransferase